MTSRDFRNIHTNGNSCRDAFSCMDMEQKLPQYFHQLMDKPLGYYFQVQSLYYQAELCNQKTGISLFSR